MAVFPDEFMTFDEFCERLQVTQTEKRLLLRSLKGSSDFHDISQRSRRLFARTGITHLIGIKDVARDELEKQSKAKAASKKKRQKRGASNGE